MKELKISPEIGDDYGEKAKGNQLQEKKLLQNLLIKETDATAYETRSL